MFPFILNKVQSASERTKLNIIRSEKVTPTKTYQTRNTAAGPINPIEEDDLCIVDYEESDGRIDEEIGEEMIRCYEAEERAWRVEQAERLTRRVQQVEQAIKAHNYRVAAAMGKKAEAKELMVASMASSISDSQRGTGERRMGAWGLWVTFTQDQYYT